MTTGPWDIDAEIRVDPTRDTLAHMSAPFVLVTQDPDALDHGT